MIEAVQQLVAAVAHFIHGALHSLLRQAEHDQGMGGEHQARLQQFGHHFVGAGGLEFRQLAVIAGAHQDRHRAVQAARRLEHRQRDIALVHCDHQQPRPFQADCGQEVAAPAVAVVHAAFSRRRFLDPHRIIVQGDVAQLLVAQEAANGLADPAIPANQYMALQLGVLRADFLQLRGLVGLAVQAGGDDRCRSQQQRGYQHRAEGGGQQQAADVGRDHLAELHLRHQGEAEFTALGQGQAAAPGGFAIAAAQLEQGRHHRTLDQQQGQGQAGDQQGMVDEQLKVDEHADADEEQPQQNVAERADVGLDLMPVMAFPQQHAGEEGPQGR